MAEMVDSNQQELPTDQIVKIASENTRSPYEFKQVYLTFVSELGMEGAVIYRFGNTIFIIHRSESNPEYGMFRALNADTAQNFVENGKKFVDQAVSDGFKGLKTQFSDPSVLNVFKIIGREEQELQNPQMGYTVAKTKDNQIQVTLVLGERLGK
jgi:hypothetical protein